MKSLLKSIGPLRRGLYRWRSRGGVGGQSDESAILSRIAEEISPTETFVEFGFHPAEFNCAELVRRSWRGLLVDGSKDQVADARRTLPPGVRVEQQFLTLETLDIIRNAFPRLGVLSVDVDGNDYWFAEALIDLRPDILIVEYNASFGREPITVPYDAAFDRVAKHPTGWYHGASLSALAILARKHGYGLHAVSSAGGNAFFTKVGTLDPVEAWRPSALRDKWSGTTWEEQFAAVADMPFVRVDS